MVKLKTHIWLALVLGILFLIGLAFSYFVLIDISQTSGTLNLTPKIVHISMINMGGFLVYILFILSKVLREDATDT